VDKEASVLDKTIDSSDMKVLGIDASNIRAGGGVTHLVEVLKRVDPKVYGFHRIIIWSNRETLQKINERDFLIKEYDSRLDGSLVDYVYWQRFVLKKTASTMGCDLLFVPGGMDVSGFKPFVTMHRNLLPFELTEIFRYKLSFRALKFLVLGFVQSLTFKRSKGVIFLTEYAQNVVKRRISDLSAHEVIIPHGVDKRFFKQPKIQYRIDSYNAQKPFKLIYISTVEPYKHQWNVVDAVMRLFNRGIPVTLDLYGSSYKTSLKKLQLAINKFDPTSSCVRYHGNIQHDNIHEKYFESDAIIFASSCETFGQILVEGMATGLPIACSNMSAMPEILQDAGFYFNPLDPSSLESSLTMLINHPELRIKRSSRSYQIAKNFSWKRCTDETFKFLQKCTYS